MNKRSVRASLAILCVFAVLSCNREDNDVVATIPALNCTTTALTTSAFTNNGTAQSTTLTVGLTNATAGSATFAIASSGSDFTPTTFAAAVTAGQTTVAIPLTFDGTASVTSETITVTASGYASGTCTAVATITSGTSSTTATSGASSTITGVLASTAATSTACASTTGVARVVCLAEAFKATLSSSQVSTVQLTYSKTNAQRWSNLPASLSSRIGINLGSLSTTQLAAFRDLMVAVLALTTANEGYDEMLGNLVADDYLGTIGGGSGYGAGNYYLSFLGTPSTTGTWEILFTGHHYTQPYTFNAGQFTGVTPAFRAIEPTTVVTSGSRSFQPMEQERQAFAAMLTGLSSTEQTTALLSSTFRDVVLGPGQDGQFPTTKVGLRVGDLTAAKKELVLNAIRLYTNDLDPTTAASVLAKYTSELDNTYIAYAGNTSVTAQNDYIRIDGPSVWIEFSYQGGVIVRNAPHPHSVWRDRTGDYGGN